MYCVEKISNILTIDILIGLNHLYIIINIELFKQMQQDTLIFLKKLV